MAPVSGTVELFPNNAGGNAIHLYGKDGNRYYFAHLSAYGETGRVSAGDVSWMTLRPLTPSAT